MSHEARYSNKVPNSRPREIQKKWASHGGHRYRHTLSVTRYLLQKRPVFSKNIGGRQGNGGRRELGLQDTLQGMPIYSLPLF